MRKGEQKYDAHYERQIRELAKNRIESGNYILLDIGARLLGRQTIEGVGRNCWVMVSSEGEVIVFDEYAELNLRTAMNQKD